MATTPNTLIFVDLASDDPAAAGKFYAEVFGWRDDERPRGVVFRHPGAVCDGPDSGGRWWAQHRLVTRLYFRRY